MTANESKKRSWVPAIMVGASVILVLLFLMYAFVQRAEADAQRRYAERYAKEAEVVKLKCVEQHEQFTDSIKALTAKLDSLKAHVSGNKK